MTTRERPLLQMTPLARTPQKQLVTGTGLTATQMLSAGSCPRSRSFQRRRKSWPLNGTPVKRTRPRSASTLLVDSRLGITTTITAASRSKCHPLLRRLSLSIKYSLTSFADGHDTHSCRQRRQLQAQAPATHRGSRLQHHTPLSKTSSPLERVSPCEVPCRCGHST